MAVGLAIAVLLAGGLYLVLRDGSDGSSRSAAGAAAEAAAPERHSAASAPSGAPSGATDADVADAAALDRGGDDTGRAARGREIAPVGADLDQRPHERAEPAVVEQPAFVSEEHPRQARARLDDPATIARSQRIEGRINPDSAKSTPAEIRRSKRMEARQGH